MKKIQALWTAAAAAFLVAVFATFSFFANGGTLPGTGEPPADAGVPDSGDVATGGEQASGGHDHGSTGGHDHGGGDGEPAAYMPPVDESTIPWHGDPGVSETLVRDTGERPEVAADGVGAFRTQCQFSHALFDDPIVYPGEAGKSHLHLFYGNTGADANATRDSIENGGNSTCRGGILNRTSYWVPAMVDITTGRVQEPPSMEVYYKSGYQGYFGRTALIQAMPNGLRMIGGGFMDGREAPEGAKLQYRCDQYRADGTHYTLEDTRQKTIPVCAEGQVLHMQLDFPQCWNGVDLDSEDHRSHMAYGSNPNGCPSTHPVPIPVITYNLNYQVGAGGTANWRLVSDMYDPTLPPGLSSHGDWWMGWDKDARDTFIRDCVQAGADCKGHLLGDGKALFYTR